MPLIEINKKQGVVLLYAVLMVSIVLTISLSLMNITYKQIILTAVGRESQIAHFTALSALDCAYFTDRSFRDNNGDDTSPNPFGKFTFSESGVTLDPPTGNSPPFPCASGASLIDAQMDLAPGAVSSIGLSATGIASRYKMTGPGLIGSCAPIEVVKVLSGDFDDFGEGVSVNDVGKVMTTAYGYNTCDVASPRRVERRVRVRSR